MLENTIILIWLLLLKTFPFFYFSLFGIFSYFQVAFSLQFQMENKKEKKIHIYSVMKIWWEGLKLKRSSIKSNKKKIPILDFALRICALFSPIEPCPPVPRSLKKSGDMFTLSLWIGWRSSFLQSLSLSSLVSLFIL